MRHITHILHTETQWGLKHKFSALRNGEAYATLTHWDPMEHITHIQRTETHEAYTIH